MSECRPQDIADLIQAIEMQDAERVRMLLDHDTRLAHARAHHRDPRGETLLQLATPNFGVRVTENDLRIAEMLLDAGADIDATGYPANNEGGTALIYAAWADHVPLVELLVERGADREARNDNGESAIDTAARHGLTDVVRVFIQAGARYSLRHVIEAGLRDEAERLLDASPEATRQADSEGLTPLHHAVGPENRHDSEIIALLLDRGADLTARDRRGRMPLHCAIDSEKRTTVDLLLSRGANRDLFAAAGLGDAAFCEASLDSAPEQAGGRQTDGVTPLFYAARFGHVDIVRMLLARGANPDIYAERWWMEPTPLHAATLHGHSAVCQCLLDAGAAVDRRNEFGYTPLLVAARWGHLPLVEAFAARGADLHAQDDNGMSALDWSVGFPDLCQAERLVALGFDPNLKGPEGSWSARTALHFAAENGKREAVAFLLASGADPMCRNREGATPLDVARRAGHPSIIELLGPHTPA